MIIKTIYDRNNFMNMPRNVYTSTDIFMAFVKNHQIAGNNIMKNN